MRCDTVHELLHDLDAGTLTPSLAAEADEHVAGCAGCRAVRADHHRVAGLLGSLPQPGLPAGFEGALERRLRAVDRKTWADRLRAMAAGLVPVVRYGGAGLAAAAATVAILYAGGVSFAPPPVPPDDTYRVSLPGDEVAARVCDPSYGEAHALRVEQGEDVDVTLSIQTPERMEGAKVYVVLPVGLSFSPDEHPDLEDLQVLAFEDDFEEGQQEIPFTVRGNRAGKWDVTALVEDADSLLLTGTTIVVGSGEAMP